MELSQSDLKALFIGIIGGLLVVLIQRIWRAYRRSSLKESLQDLEWEREHFTEIAKSSVALNRSAFRSIFFIFCFVGIAHIIDFAFSELHPLGISPLNHIGDILEIAAWATVTFTSWRLFRLYTGLRNYKETLRTMDDKIQHAKQRLEGS